MVNYSQTIVQTLIARLTNFPEGLCVTPLINSAANSVAVLLALATRSLSSGSSGVTFVLLGLRVVLLGDLRAVFVGGTSVYEASSATAFIITALAVFAACHVDLLSGCKSDEVS